MTHFVAIGVCNLHWMMKRWLVTIDFVVVFVTYELRLVSVTDEQYCGFEGMGPFVHEFLYLYTTYTNQTTVKLNKNGNVPKIRVIYV